MKDNSLINDIIIKAITEEELSSAESVILDEWLTDDENSKLFERLKDKDYLLRKLIEAHEIDMEGDRILLQQKMEIGKRIHIRQRQWKLFRDVATSAAAVLILTAAIFLMLNKSEKADSNTVSNAKTPTVAINDAEPGKATALLTFAGGNKMVLDSTVVGPLAKQGTAVLVNEKGTLRYQANDQQNDELYNTLSTANGETYAMVLADGSKVWLNTGASIRYPVAFTGSERKVEITGEVYFEVAHDTNKPFIVHVTGNKGAGMDVQVLGTHFNVNAYDDEPVIRTTLLEGSVKIKQGSAETLLKPGQQAQVGSGITKVQDNVNVIAAVAWHNGRFNFENEDITVIMRQLAKWYNVEVVYEGARPTDLLVWEAERNQMLSEAVRLLELNGLHLRIEGKKLIVMSPDMYEAWKSKMKQQK